MKYESHFLNPEQSKTSIRSRIPNKIDLYTYIFVFYLILKCKDKCTLWTWRIRLDLSELKATYLIIQSFFFLCLGRRFFFLPQTRISKRRLEKWEHWNFGTNCFPSQVLLQRPAVAAALSCAVVKYSVSIWKIAMDYCIGDEESVQLKPIP